VMAVAIVAILVVAAVGAYLLKSPASHPDWHFATFPPPNGGGLAFTIKPDGNPACASYDQAGCLWGVAIADLDFGKLKPLECGDMHYARWGVTGYEDPKHWCNLAKVAATAH